jgi:hypothetical protein
MAGDHVMQVSYWRCIAIGERAEMLKETECTFFDLCSPENISAIRTRDFTLRSKNPSTDCARSAPSPGRQVHRA